jgi:hypothetical protein
VPIPEVNKVTSNDIQENYLMIKSDILNLIKTEIDVLKARKAVGIPPESNSTSNERTDDDTGDLKGAAISL